MSSQLKLDNFLPKVRSNIKSVCKRKGSEYYFMGYGVVLEGECALITNSSGASRLVEGPASPFLFRETFEKLDRATAHPGEYIIIEYKDGKKDHITGPASVFFNPIKHDTVSVGRALTINTGQAVVVYSRETQGGATTDVVHGPSIRVLGSNEWLHQFSWMIPNQSNPSQATKHPLTFFKLRTIPDQFYFNVIDVRTSDDAVLTVKLMIFYHLKDILKMLSTTHDPATELSNGITADIIDFASCRTFDEFKRDSDQLNKVETYHQTHTRFSALGYDLTKVIYRGYDSSKALQHMHEMAIETRTQLRLKAEAEKEEQELENHRLECKQKRTAQELELERQKLEHTRSVNEVNHVDSIKRRKDEHEEVMRQKQVLSQFEIETLKQKQKIELEHQQALKNQEADYYAKLHKDTSLDLTKYLVAKHTNIDQSIRLISDTETSNPNFHLHQNLERKAKL
eukprot:TRINITY_DN4041_c0_g1_i1.p1 TRINITY_DN4041_c0_g1~~TRINITY_DN4041_c0_g1_i1.p1  ORF type:complete len:454 (-),score=118.71 TRINITY_DN4041_c0_g1_i1:35-1396(-)